MLRFHFSSTCVPLVLHTCLLCMLCLLSSSCNTCIVCMFSSSLMHVNHAFTLHITCVPHMSFTIYTVDRSLVMVVYSLTIYFLLKTLGSTREITSCFNTSEKLVEL